MFTPVNIKYPPACALIILAMFSSAALAGDADGTQIAPPALVQCQSKTDCDRDPKHLEQFVTGLYRWYASSEMQIWQSHSDTKLKQRREELYTMLTPSFAAAIKQDVIKGERDGEMLHSDPLTHINGFFFFEWASTSYSKVVQLSDDTVKAIAYLPIPPGKNFSPPITYCQVHLTLKPTDGTWRVSDTGGDEVECLNGKKDSDK